MHGLHLELQSAYKKHHSTESALLKVKNDILLNTDAQKVTLLVLSDLSAAFVTVRHDILLDRLRSRLCVTDQALNWFTSYISDRTQLVAVNGGLSDTFSLAKGVPQGSCLGPLLLCTSGIYQRIIRYNGSTLAPMSCNMYLAFSPNVRGDDASVVKAMCDCIMDLRKWMIRDRLMFHDDKTEFLLLGTKKQLAKVDINSITVGESVVNTKPVVRNLGSWFDSQLSKSIHISKLCSSAFFHLITSVVFASSHTPWKLSPWCTHSLLLVLTTAIAFCMVYLPRSLTRLSVFYMLQRGLFAALRASAIITPLH